ncbi:L-rhamnose mutarotase [Mangrovibacterium sp.]|uniref:L-rhamnose mutarotase n=1 Tax=Mangrovibacterium sp. TaxID=1961364 RepID=UPI0035628EC1
MNQTNIHNLLSTSVLALLLLVACQSKNSPKSDESAALVAVDRVAFELILDDVTRLDSLLNQIDEISMDSYQWKNHIVLFGEVKDTIGVRDLLLNTGVNLKIKTYDNPFYVFDREQHCGDSLVLKPWKNYLLTANLVADSLLQKEYMHYHAVQFDKWPEVANGFCNAQFQQLLVYRNERQLMLVISVPADKTLDELNPITEENNPRVAEWNQLMSRYQEGIAGTAPGESWVFFEPVSQ